MKLKIIYVESGSDSAIEKICEEYIKRIKLYSSPEIIKIPAAKNERNIQNIIRKEGEKILKKIQNKDYLIGLDENGKEYSSVKFSQKLSQWQMLSIPVVFVIGGSYGLDDTVKSQCKELIALSKMTLPHRLARILLLEQIYRGFSIMKGEKYHHV